MGEEKKMGSGCGDRREGRDGRVRDGEKREGGETVVGERWTWRKGVCDMENGKAEGMAWWCGKRKEGPHPTNPFLPSHLFPTH